MLATLMPGCAFSSELSRQRSGDGSNQARASDLHVLPERSASPPPPPVDSGPPGTPVSTPAPSHSDASRTSPRLPSTPAALASVLEDREIALRDPATPSQLLPLLAHQQQVIYRLLARQPELAAQVRQALPARWQPVLDLHLAARRAFLAMHPPRGGVSVVPAWRIRSPAPEAELLALYRQAAQSTGIPWEVLAAINLVESGMGRIDGVSVAGAHGPMQFLPSTWSEPGIGQGGDIRDPRDAIPAAARYLVRRGGLRDMRRALWGYNNSDHYGRGVLAYAALLRQDPAAYRG